MSSSLRDLTRSRLASVATSPTLSSPVRASTTRSRAKGCYIGREVVAKIDTYGGVWQAGSSACVSNDDPIAPGTPLMRD